MGSPETVHCLNTQSIPTRTQAVIARDMSISRWFRVAKQEVEPRDEYLFQRRFMEGTFIV
jgi:hypothetical protein